MLAGLCLQPGAWDATTGAMEHVDISDITMHNVTTPLFCVVKPGNTASDVTISRLTATGVYRTACSIESWASTPIRRFSLTDISIRFRGGGTKEQAGIQVRGPGVDARALPVWGLYARNVEDLRMENVRFSREEDDERPVLLFEDVRGLTLNGFRRPAATDTITYKNVERQTIRDIETPL